MSKPVKICDLVDRDKVIDQAEDMVANGNWVIRKPLHQDWLLRWAIVLERK